MRARYLVLPALALVLASCGSPEAAPDPEPVTSAVETTPEPTEEPTEEPATEEPTTAPDACEAGTPETTIGKAVHATDLPDTVVLTGVQEVSPHRDEDQSMVDVVLYLCGLPLSEDEHREIASDLAWSAESSSEGERINRFSVQLYTVNDDGAQEMERNLRVTDFQVHLWDEDPDRPVQPESKWETA